MNKGEIRRRAEVWCGLCGHWEFLVSAKMVFAKREAREKGWQEKKNVDWICPACVKKEALQC